MPNKMKELRGMSEEQLTLTLKDTEKHLFQLRFQSATDRLETPSEIRKAKRDIARIKTLQRAKELKDLEALATEGYRSEKLTHHQAAQLLGMTRFEFDGFLKDRQIYDHAYSVEDLERDLETMRRLEDKGLLRRP